VLPLTSTWLGLLWNGVDVTSDRSANELNDQVLGEFGTSCIYCTGVPYGWTCGGCVYYYDFSDDGRFELQRLLGLLEDFIKRSNTTNMK